MSNPIKKTMVYLGLADEELDSDTAPRQSETRADARSAAAAQSERSQAVNTTPPSSASRSSVTPLRKTSPARNAATSDMNEILTVHPRQYRDAQAIAESFRDGIPVIINLSQMSDADARRLIDFSSGLSEGLHGKIERVTAKVFLLSPSHVVVSGEGSGDAVLDETDSESSFFAQS
jgi:cell division inhibitor SepF